MEEYFCREDRYTARHELDLLAKEVQPRECAGSPFGVGESLGEGWGRGEGGGMCSPSKKKIAQRATGFIMVRLVFNNLKIFLAQREFDRVFSHLPQDFPTTSFYNLNIFRVSFKLSVGQKLKKANI